MRLDFLPTLPLRLTVPEVSVYKPPSHDAWRGLERFQGKGLRRGGWVGTPATARRADLPVSQTDDSRLGGRMGAALWDDPLKYSVHAMFTYRASCTSYTPSVCACIHIYIYIYKLTHMYILQNGSIHIYCRPAPRVHIYEYICTYMFG